jgi:hypothetical protein
MAPRLAQWSELVAFEVYPVISSAAAAERIAPRLRDLARRLIWVTGKTLSKSDRLARRLRRREPSPQMRRARAGSCGVTRRATFLSGCIYGAR